MFLIFKNLEGYFKSNMLLNQIFLVKKFSSCKDLNLRIHILFGEMKVVKKDDQFISVNFETSFIEIHGQMPEIWSFQCLLIRFQK